MPPAAAAASSASFRHVPPRIRIVAFNDVYELANLPRLQTFLRHLAEDHGAASRGGTGSGGFIGGQPQAVVLAGDFLSPSTLSALDGGKGMVQTLRAIGLTHASLGNHEADLKLPKLEKRLKSLAKSVVVLNTNISGTGKAPWLRSADWMHPHSVVRSPCGRVRAGLVGLMSDEKSMFRDGTFRGAPIGDVCDAVRAEYDSLVRQQHIADTIVPLTHQTMDRDQELAAYMLAHGMGSTVILGGHEHTPLDKIVRKEGQAEGPGAFDEIRILKSGSDADAVHLVDLIFDLSPVEDHENSSNINGSGGIRHKARVVEIEAQLIEMKDFEPSAVVQNIVDSHMAMLTSMENEVIFHASDSLLSPLPSNDTDDEEGPVLLSSVGTRYQQTTVGAIFCTAIKEELEVDVAVLNGAPIKGNATYINNAMTYMQLKRELPFPTKIVVVPMSRSSLADAIQHSRSLPLLSDDPTTERRGFLQVDVEYDRRMRRERQLRSRSASEHDSDEILMVALPRNLLNGFCNIQPLVDVGKDLKAKGTFPSGEDDFIPAIDLVIRHFCKERWYQIVRDHAFEDLDTARKGFLSREDVKRMLQKAIGHEPAGFVVEDMIAAADEDGNGVIDPEEFSHLLAEMERENKLAR